MLSPAAPLRTSPRHAPVLDDTFPRPKPRHRQRDAAQTVPRRCADAAPSPNVTARRREKRRSAPPVAAADVIDLDAGGTAPGEAGASSFQVPGTGPVKETGCAPAGADEIGEVAAWGAELQERHRDLVKRDVAFAAEHAVFAEEEMEEGWMVLTPPGLDFSIGLQEREIDYELQKREEVRAAKKAVRERRGRERVGLMEKVLWDSLKQEREKNASMVSSLVTDCGLSALVEKQRLQLGDQRAQIEDQRAALEQQLQDQAELIAEQGDMIAKQRKQIDELRAAARMEKVMVTSSADEDVFKKKEKKIQRELAKERRDRDELLDIIGEQRDQLEMLRELARTERRTDDVGKKRLERGPRKSDGLVAQRREQKKLLSGLIDYQGRDMAVPGKKESDMRFTSHDCGKEDEISGGHSVSSAWVFGFAVLVPRWYQRGDT